MSSSPPSQAPPPSRPTLRTPGNSCWSAAAVLGDIAEAHAIRRAFGGHNVALVFGAR